jgi:hypothetical protein
VEEYKPVYLKANIELQDETDELKAAASIIELPKDGEKQIDLQYFSAVFVSSGGNLNHAYFLPSELVKAEGTIVNKAMDLEHSEDEIVGHIYERAFMDKEGNKIELEELASMETASLDNQEFHIAIAGIVYKNRFPDLAREVASGKWSVSMEAYFRNYDVKIGNLIISKPEAEALGLAHDDNSIYGRAAKVIKRAKEIAKGNIDRVLRDITFSGCGFVKKPANPPSVVLETANEKVKDIPVDEEVIVLDYDKLEEEGEEVADIKVTSVDTEASKSEEGELQYNDTVGICVSYKKEVYDSTFKDELSKIVHSDWCALYELSCTSFSRDTTDPKCLRNTIREAAEVAAQRLMKELASKDRRKEKVERLKKLL